MPKKSIKTKTMPKKSIKVPIKYRAALKLEEELWDNRDAALNLLVEIANDPSRAETDELDRVLDLLALTHVTATLEWGSGCLSLGLSGSKKAA